ncbi:hypothetical protein ACWOFR_06140 [Carnobacterium gallinarum]|uniref:hypothetical protein n=1 Tax=Carnobacterium gallinarum TaxID=2749 RepID=UPI000553DF39|nr:hypothetical protein [Carnobacterium gallinarum]
MNEKSEQLIQSTKKLTLPLAIIYTISSLFLIISSMGLMLIQSIDYSKVDGFTQTQADLLKSTSSGLAAYTMYGITLASIVLTVFLYIYNVRLKKGIVVGKVPYLGVGALQLYSIVKGIMMIIGGLRIGEIAITSNIVSLGINLAILILAILALKNLFKLDTEKSEIKA